MQTPNIYIYIYILRPLEYIMSFPVMNPNLLHDSRTYPSSTAKPDQYMLSKEYRTSQSVKRKCVELLMKHQQAVESGEATQMLN